MTDTGHGAHWAQQWIAEQVAKATPQPVTYTTSGNGAAMPCWPIEKGPKNG
jgi:hypothetical protein